MLKLNGTVTGRAHSNGPVDILGNPVACDHDDNVTLTVTVYPPGGHASSLVIWLPSLERGTLEQGDAVVITVATLTESAEEQTEDTGTGVVEPAAAVKSEPYSIVPVNEATTP